MKILIVLALVAVLGALASAGVFMLKRRPGIEQPGQRDRRMARALALRIGLSVALFLFILLAWALGWVKPTGLPVVT
jgi:uncharacterized iron-regulated membrane protein